MTTETIYKHINENADSITLSTPAKGGEIKVYGDYNDAEAFKAKIKKAIEVRRYAQTELEMNT